MSIVLGTPEREIIYQMAIAMRRMLILMPEKSGATHAAKEALAKAEKLLDKDAPKSEWRGKPSGD